MILADQLEPSLELLDSGCFQDPLCVSRPLHGSSTTTVCAQALVNAGMAGANTGIRIELIANRVALTISLCRAGDGRSVMCPPEDDHGVV